MQTQEQNLTISRFIKLYGKDDDVPGQVLDVDCSMLK